VLLGVFFAAVRFFDVEVGSATALGLLGDTSIFLLAVVVVVVVAGACWAAFGLGRTGELATGEFNRAIDSRGEVRGDVRLVEISFGVIRLRLASSGSTNESSANRSGDGGVRGGVAGAEGAIAFDGVEFVIVAATSGSSGGGGMIDVAGNGDDDVLGRLFDVESMNANGRLVVVRWSLRLLGRRSRRAPRSCRESRS
jgi:hypothetical protein